MTTKYQIIRPDSLLQKYIEYFWLAETNDYFEYISPASTLVDLVFFCKGEVKNLLTQEKISESGMIFGQKTSFARYQGTDSSSKLLGIRVRPSFFLLTLKIPATEFSEQQLRLEHLFGNEAERIIEDALENHTLPKIATNFSNLLRRKANDLPPKYHAIEKWISTTNLSRENLLAQKTHLSERQFERNFKDFVGFSLRKYIQLKRFEQVLHFLITHHSNSKSLTEIAYQFGYYDQSHFNRDFKKFWGSSPLQLNKR